MGTFWSDTWEGYSRVRVPDQEGHLRRSIQDLRKMREVNERGRGYLSLSLVLLLTSSFKDFVSRYQSLPVMDRSLEREMSFLRAALKLKSFSH